MNKGLIDLKRASTPPANPLVTADTLPEPETRAQAAEIANLNQEEAPSLAIVTEIQPVPAPQVERISTIGARIPETLHQNIKLFCIGNRIEMQHFVQEALSLHLERLQESQKG
jgi:hypothetical protein